MSDPTTMSRTPATTSPPAEGGSNTTGGVASAATEQATSVVDEARRHTSRLLGETGDRAREHADEQLHRTAGFVEQLGSELDDMAAHSTQPDGYLVALARDGAQTARQLSRRMDEGGLEAVLDDVTRFARRRPGMFLAASFAVGLALGRVTRNADFGQIKHDMADGSESRDAADPRATYPTYETSAARTSAGAGSSAGSGTSSTGTSAGQGTSSTGTSSTGTSSTGTSAGSGTSSTGTGTSAGSGTSSTGTGTSAGSGTSAAGTSPAPSTSGTTT